jgi:hypothetical protein
MTFDVTPSPATPLCAGGDYWYEAFTATEGFEACGRWRALIDDALYITGTVDGTFGYGDRTLPGSHRFCRASDHQFTLTRR